MIKTSQEKKKELAPKELSVEEAAVNFIILFSFMGGVFLLSAGIAAFAYAKPQLDPYGKSLIKLSPISASHKHKLEPLFIIGGVLFDLAMLVVVRMAIPYIYKKFCANDASQGAGHGVGSSRLCVEPGSYSQ